MRDGTKRGNENTAGGEEENPTRESDDLEMMNFADEKPKLEEMLRRSCRSHLRSWMLLSLRWGSMNPCSSTWTVKRPDAWAEFHRNNGNSQEFSMDQ